MTCEVAQGWSKEAEVSRRANWSYGINCRWNVRNGRLTFYAVQVDLEDEHQGFNVYPIQCTPIPSSIVIVGRPREGAEPLEKIWRAVHQLNRESCSGSCQVKRILLASLSESMTAGGLLVIRSLAGDKRESA